MKIRTNESRFSDLAKALEQVDDNGRHGECGSWGMSLGGYDTGYEISYDGETIGRVNYGDKEYELYRDDCVSKDEVPEFLSAIDADGFKNAAESVEVKEDGNEGFVPAKMIEKWANDPQEWWDRVWDPYLGDLEQHVEADLDVDVSAEGGAVFIEPKDGKAFKGFILDDVEWIAMEKVILDKVDTPEEYRMEYAKWLKYQIAEEHDRLIEPDEYWDEASDESVKHVLVKEDAGDNTKSRTESLKLTADYFLGQLRGLVDKVSKEDSEGAKLFFKNANNTLKDLVRQFEDLKANF